MTKKTDPVICFQAQVWSIKTLADGGMNVTLSLSDEGIKQISKLLQCKKLNALLEVTAVPIKPAAKEKNAKQRAKRVQRYPYRTEA